MPNRVRETLRRTACSLLLVGSATGAPAQQGIQNPTAIQRAVDDYLRVQTGGLPGQATFSTTPLDPRLTLPACAALEVFTPPGARLWGNSTVGVRCSAPAPWAIYVGVAVRVTGTYLATARAVASGQALTQSDLTSMQGDLTQFPAGLVTDMSQALGKISNAPLAPGQPLRADLLRTLPAILQGQTVRIVSQGPGFRVSAEGKALANAAAGQVAQVRTASGQTVSGIVAQDGTIQMRF